jgi:hypothetical protein
MSSKDQLLLEQAYNSIFIEQHRLIEEGKIWDYIKGMGGKLKNAWDVINTKIASNPKLYKTLMVAGPILAALAAKNFQHLNVPSDVVQSLLDTLNGVDPNITTDDLTHMLTNWDHDHAASLGKFTQHTGGGFTSTDINVGDNHNGQYSFNGSHLNTTEGDTGNMAGQVLKDANVQTVSQSLQSITTSSDLGTVIKDFTSEITKSTNTDGSGGSSLVSYTGVVTASSPEEAMKIVSELLKSAIDKSGIDIKTLNIGQPQATLIAAESLYRINPAEYLLEFAALDKFKSAVKNTANKVVAGVKSIVVGAQALAAQIKSTFKKQPNAPEQQYKVNLQVTIPQV